MCPITPTRVSDTVSSVPEAYGRQSAARKAYSGGKVGLRPRIQGASGMGERSKGKDKGKAKKAQKASKPDKRPHVQQKEQQDATRPPV